jgi:hypothetical protein
LPSAPPASPHHTAPYQVHGAHGISQDSKLPDMWMNLRTLRVADGPDAVHLDTVVKSELAENQNNPIGMNISGENKNIKK